MVLGPRSHPRETLHRQRRRSHGRQAQSPAGRNASGASPACLRRHRRGVRTARDRLLRPRKKSFTTASGKPFDLGWCSASEDAYAFQHDRVQEAAYSLIPEDARAEAHLRIGRLLVAHTPPDKREEIIFDIVNQFNRGAELITSEDEREQVAELNLIAGKRAKASTAYASALRYFIAGAAPVERGLLGAPPRSHLPTGAATGPSASS